MAVFNKRTRIALVLLIVNIYCAKSDSDADYNTDDSKTDQVLKDNGDVIDDTNIQNYEKDQNLERREELVTEAYKTTTTDVTDDYLNNDEESNETNESTTETADTVTDDYTLSMTEYVYKPKDGTEEDIYSANNEGKTETTTQATTRSIEEIEKSQDLDDLEVPGSRNPKTENAGPQHPDIRTFDIKPRTMPAISRSSTLKSWLEDSWLRPPAGLLVPLRPIALSRALAVWNDLMIGGLNVSDIVIVGYDSNGVSWRSRHNLQPSSNGGRERDVSESLSKLLLKYQGFHTDSSVDGTMKALTTAAKLVPYDSALFLITDKGAGDPQKLPLALRALVEKRLKVYTIWTDPNHLSAESEAALQELKNISKHTEGDVLPYSLQVMDVDSPSNLASEVEFHNWAPLELKQPRKGRISSEHEFERFDTLLVRRGGAEAISLGLPIESGVTALKIFIEGAVEHAVFYPPNDASQIDFYNTTSVSAFSSASRTEGLNPREVYLVFPGAKLDVDMLSVLPANPVKSDTQSALVGAWHLSVRCDTCDYRLAVAARSLIHLDVEAESTNMLRIRVTGPVASVRESLLIDEYGTELAKLSFSYQPMTGEEQEAQVDTVTELVADVAVPAFKGSKVYVKIVGRDVHGEPFVRLSGLLYQPEVRLGRSAAIVFPDAASDLELAEEENAKVYSRLRYNESSVLPFGRAVSQVVNQHGSILTAVQIGLSTKLYGSPGDNLQLHFEVTNYREQSVNFRFGAVGELRFLTGISPATQTIPSGQTVNVIVSATITSLAQPGARDFVTFTAYGLEQVSISAYIYVVNPSDTTADVWAPEVRHNFQGSCIGRQDTDCAQHVWSATIIARDAQGGILRLTSSPIGLMYDSNFISGTREEVIATYRATCCAPRVMITAVDSYGNVRSYTVDISSYFTPAAIAAIVLGVLLAIAIIILIGYLIYWCVKRRKESRELPYSTSSRNIN